jgi:transposase-like protein
MRKTSWPIRGVIVTYEAIRQWTLKLGQDYANTLRRQQPKRGDKWHLDEVVLTMDGKHHHRLAGSGSGRLHARHPVTTPA